MVEIYVSWCKDIIEDKEALNILKDSKIIDGIETSEVNDENNLKKEGLKISLHRPFRRKVETLENPELDKTLEENQEILNKINRSNSFLVGFHVINYALEDKKNIKETLEICKKNIQLLKKKLDRKIVFETSPYCKSVYERRGKEFLSYFTSPEMIGELVNENCGFLFDISHNYISCMNKIMEGKYDKTIEEYFREIIKASDGNILQIHLNFPVKEKEFLDKHTTFEENSKTNDEIIKLTKYVIDNSPNLKVLTLEMNTNLSPKEHAKKMIEQTKILRKLLDLDQTSSDNFLN